MKDNRVLNSRKRIFRDERVYSLVVYERLEMIRKLLEKYEGTYSTGGHRSAKRIEPGGSGSRN